MPCPYSITVYGEAIIHATGEVVYERQVPCGKCTYCNSRHAYNVYKRLEYESSLYDEFALFITLTYSDDNVPTGPAYRPQLTGSTVLLQNFQTGAPFIRSDDRYYKSKIAKIHFADEHPHEEFPHVSKRDFQLFMKKLRNRLGEGVRFFCLAEYGGQTARPHYHVLLFNHGLNLKTQAQAFDSSTVFANLWGKGHCLCEIAPTSAMKYVSGYHAIRQMSPPGSCPSFVLSSRRPGIGSLQPKDSKWIKDHSFTNRATAYMRLSSYQRKQVYPDGDFLAMSADIATPDQVRDYRVDMWFQQQKLRDHGKFSQRLNENNSYYE